MASDLLSRCATPRDALPYTQEFDILKAQYEQRTGKRVSNSEFWQILTRVGKRGGLGGTARRRQAPRTEPLTTEQQLELLRLFPEGIGSRDRLPYTAEFDEVYERFHRLTGVRLSKHAFWRALSRVAKRSRKPRPVFEMAPLGGLAPEVVQFLERTNPWWRGLPSVQTESFRRWAFEEAMRRLESNIAPVIAIRGPRQVGKTTIQMQIIEHLLMIRHIPPARILRVQFDELPGLGALVHPVETLVRWYEDNVLREPINALARRGETVYLFFDELQNLRLWAAQLKALVDHVSARTLVTGSSALRIARQRESLAGRVSMIELGPLRLYEIAGIRSLGNLPPFLPGGSLQDWTTREFWLGLASHARSHGRVLEQAFLEFSHLGGYPRCHKPGNEDTSLLASQIVETVVNRTIDYDPVIDRGRRSLNRMLIKETFRLVCRYAGQSVSPRRMADEIGKILSQGIAEDRVSQAVQFLADAMLVHQVPSLELLLRKQGHPPKLCLCDHFVRNAWLHEAIPIAPDELAARPDAISAVAGHIVESVVGYYLMGIPGMEMAWFPPRKDEPEVDFVLTIGTRRIPIEIKYRRGGVDSQDVKGIESFCNNPNYEAAFGIVVTQTESRTVSERVIALPASSVLIVR